MVLFSKLKKDVVAVVLVLALCAGVFVVSVNHAFIIWDDDKNVYENELISRYTTEHIQYFWEHPFLGLYIPVTYSVWAMLAYNSEAEVNPGAGKKPIVSARNYHLANLLLHLGSVALVIALYHRLLGREDLFAAAVGASLFAFHPLQVEPVAWVTGMKDVLSGFLALACVVIFLKASSLMRRQIENGELKIENSPGGKRGTWKWVFYGLSIFVYAVALLSKPQLVIIPPIIGILEIFVRRAPWKQTCVLLIPFFVLAIAATVTTMIVQPDQDAIFPFEKPSLLLRVVVGMDALAFYMSKLIYPFNLATDHGRTPAKALEVARHFPVWTIPALVFAGLLCIRKHKRYYLSAAAVTLIGVGPVLGLIPFAYQGQSTVADRYVYIAMIGIGFGLASYLKFSKSALPRVIAVALVPVMAVIAFKQVQKWENTMTLFDHGLKVNPVSLAATYNLGLAHSKDGNFQEALDYYHKAIEIKDDFERPWNNIGFVLNTLGRFQESIPYLERAIELDDANASAFSNIGIAYDSLGDYAKAIKFYDMALERDPGSVAAYTNLGLAYTHAGDYAKAERSLNQAVRLNPTMHNAYGGLGRVYMKTENWTEAIAAYQNLTNLRTGSPQDWRDLASAFAKNGQFPQALQATQGALRVVKDAPNLDPSVIDLLNQEIQIYQSGKMPDGDYESRERLSRAGMIVPAAPAKAKVPVPVPVSAPAAAPASEGAVSPAGGAVDVPAAVPLAPEAVPVE